MSHFTGRQCLTPVIRPGVRTEGRKESMNTSATIRKRRSLRKLFLSAGAALAAAMLLSAGVLAKDVSNKETKPQKVKVNKMISGKFEKKNDRDCFSFKSTGGSYQLLIWDLSGRKGEDLRKAAYDHKSIDIMFGPYEVFSPAAGAKKQKLIGETYNTWFTPDEEDGNNVAYSVIDLRKYKKGKEVGIVLTGKYKGKYKFKVVRTGK